MRIIDVCSGKGGVGKTTITANLAVALQKSGKKVAIVDCNLTTSHLSLLFGIYSYPVTLNNFLRSEAKAEEIIYNHTSGMKIIPASLEIKDIIDVDASNLREKLKDTFNNFDIVLLDSAPGLGRESMIALQTADEVIFVADPYIPSLVDVAKCKKLISGMESGPSVTGIILNRVRKKKYEISAEEIKEFTNLPIIGTIPEDDNVLECTNKKCLVTLSKENSPSSKAFFEIGRNLSGIPYTQPKNFFAKFIDLFKK
jgi:septum site-determining protein MinD